MDAPSEGIRQTSIAMVNGQIYTKDPVLVESIQRISLSISDYSLYSGSFDESDEHDLRD